MHTPFVQKFIFISWLHFDVYCVYMYFIFFKFIHSACIDDLTRIYFNKFGLMKLQ